MQKCLPPSLTEIRKKNIKALQMFCFALFSNRMQERKDTKIFFWPSIICWNGKFWFYSMKDPSWRFNHFVAMYSVSYWRELSNAYTKSRQCDTQDWENAGAARGDGSVSKQKDSRKEDYESLLIFLRS